MTQSPEQRDTYPITLRPLSAYAIPALVYLVIAYLLIDAIIKGAWGTVATFAPWLALVGVGIWVILASPAVTVERDRVHMRNIFHTYSAHYSAVSNIGLGAMVSMYVRQAHGPTKKVIAWNAPGVGRDKPADVHTRSHISNASATGHDSVARHVGPAERLRNDQRKSDSFALLRAWDAWWDSHRDTPESIPDDTVLETRVRWIPIALLAAAAAWCALSVVL